MRAWIEIQKNYCKIKKCDVALFMRAWIEMALSLRGGRSCKRRPLHEAWIEILLSYLFHGVIKVALFMRAWIEIERLRIPFLPQWGRPLHEGVD